MSLDENRQGTRSKLSPPLGTLGGSRVNLPNALTLSRIFIVPLLVVVLLTPFSENWFGVQRHLLGVALFLAAAFTDYLDGHIARSRDQISRLGILLDPIADKLLISGALISLVENRLAPAWAVVIIVGREFAVSGLRSIAAADGVVIAASRMGKFKMMSQVLAVALLIASSVSGEPPVANFGRAFPAIQFWSVPELKMAVSHLFISKALTMTDFQVLLYTAGRAMLWVVVVSACFSMYEYFRAFYHTVTGRTALENEARAATLSTPVAGRALPRKSKKVSVG
jgi:CDP-diacylglycerol--glycerol-3-phosphate 3-phosphatidyltransferase